MLSSVFVCLSVPLSVSLSISHTLSFSDYAIFIIEKPWDMAEFIVGSAIGEKIDFDNGVCVFCSDVF